MSKNNGNTTVINNNTAVVLSDTMKGLTNITSENVLDMKNYLINIWAPIDAADAIKMKNIQHIFKSADKSISSACAEELDKLKNSDKVITDSISGLSVLRKNKASTKIYNETDDTRRLEDEIEDLHYKMEELMEPYKEKLKRLQSALKVAKEEAGFTEQDNGFTYAVKF